MFINLYIIYVTPCPLVQLSMYAFITTCTIIAAIHIFFLYGKEICILYNRKKTWQCYEKVHTYDLKSEAFLHQHQVKRLKTKNIQLL